MKASEVNIRDLLDFNRLIRDRFDEISGIKEALANEDYDLAGGYWQDIPKVETDLLWRAPSKGGIFTTIERGQMENARKQFIKAVSSEEFEQQKNY